MGIVDSIFYNVRNRIIWLHYSFVVCTFYTGSFPPSSKFFFFFNELNENNNIITENHFS